jgi:hypothetical protein
MVDRRGEDVIVDLPTPGVRPDDPSHREEAHPDGFGRSKRSRLQAARERELKSKV